MQSRNAEPGMNLSRRRLFGVIAGAGVAAATGMRVAGVSANDGVKYTTTAALNLRKKPNSSSGIIRVIPKGAVVIDYDGEVVNNYRSIDYNGSVGWVSTAYLVKGTPPPAKPVIIGGAKTTSNVNFRYGPGSGYGVIKVVAAGTWVDITAKTENGYRYVVLNGTAGWIADAYLGGSEEGAFVATANVNMRSGPGTGYSVKVVVPKGATVIDYNGELKNGFRGVDYKGTVGWVADAYLAKV